jgi:hypothetical protein
MDGSLPDVLFVGDALGCVPRSVTLALRAIGSSLEVVFLPLLLPEIACSQVVALGALGAERQAVEHYYQVGQDLLRAKATVARGEWLAWLKQNVKFKQSMAYYCMGLAKVPTVGNLVERWREITGRGQEEGSENGEATAADDATEEDKTPECYTLA